jgi:hypothetical protein
MADDISSTIGAAASQYGIDPSLMVRIGVGAVGFISNRRSWSMMKTTAK